MTMSTPELSQGDDLTEVQESEGEARIEGRSPSQLALARLKKDRMTQVALGIAALFILIGIVAPILVKFGVLDPYTGHNTGKGSLLYADGNRIGLPKGSFGGVSWSHPFGVDPLNGRDLLSRLMLGTTYSLFIALAAMIISIVIGTVLGLLSGFIGGKVDFFISRFIDLVLSFPQVLMLLALSGTFILALQKIGLPGGNVSTGVYVVLVLGVFGWPAYARVIRSQVMSLRHREFVEAARSLGSSNRRIYFTEILPSLWPPILVYSSLILPINVSTAAALRYLGVGIKPPTPTLGNILTDSVNYSISDPTYFFLPALFIVLIVLAFNLVGDGIGDAIDPKKDR